MVRTIFILRLSVIFIGFKKKENGIPFVQKTFQHKGEAWSYWVFEVPTEPGHFFGTIGDVSLEKGGSRAWVRLLDRWELVSRQLGAHGRPVQKHPILMGERRLCPKNTWKSQTHWNVEGVRKKLDKDGSCESLLVCTFNRSSDGSSPTSHKTRGRGWARRAFETIKERFRPRHVIFH